MLNLWVEMGRNTGNKKKLPTFAFQNHLQVKRILTEILKIYGKELSDC
jgi:hypothetical protein